MTISVPKGLLGYTVEQFEILLDRAVEFLGLHPHEFPKDEHLSLESLRGVLIQLKAVAGLLGQDEIVGALEGAELVVEGVEVIADIVDELQDEEKSELEPIEPVIEDESGEGDSIDGEEPDVESIEVSVDEEPEIVEEPIEVEEEVELDEKVEEEGQEVEAQAEEGEEARKKIEALEEQLADLKKTIGD